jgi:hypothetical protein
VTGDLRTKVAELEAECERLRKALQLKVPADLPPRIWLIVDANGETHLLRRPPIEGMAKWSEGLGVTIVQYRFEAVTRSPSSTEKKTTR